MWVRSHTFSLQGQQQEPLPFQHRCTGTSKEPNRPPLGPAGGHPCCLLAECPTLSLRGGLAHPAAQWWRRMTHFPFEGARWPLSRRVMSAAVSSRSRLPAQHSEARGSATTDRDCTSPLHVSGQPGSSRMKPERRQTARVLDQVLNRCTGLRGRGT